MIDTYNKFMQLLQSFPPDLRQSKKLQVSKLFYSSSSSLPSIVNNRSKSLQFIPYVQQRDKLGRLLTDSVFNKNKSYQTGMLLAESKLFDEQKQKNKKIQCSPQQSRINKAVQCFFKKIDMQTRQLARGKIVSRKIMISLQKQHKKDFYLQADYDITKALDFVKTKIKDCTIKPASKSNSPTKLTKSIVKQQHSPILLSSLDQLRIKQHQQRILKKSQSMFERNRRQNSPNSQILSPLKKPIEQQKHKKSQSLMGSLKVKLNPEHPDYRRYKQQQQRQLKVFDDYEQGHLKFKQKMKESKLIAYNIKKQLQID